MIEFFLKMHAFFYGKNQQKDYKHNNKFAWIVFNILARLLESFSYYGIKIRAMLGFMPRPLSNTNGVVVSLTSFPARINEAWMVVDCMMRQSYLPKKVFLFLSKEQFLEGRKSVPQNLLRYEKYGLEVHFVDGDLKPHKKYFYAFLSLQDECVVTVDDDVLYRKDMLERLWNMHKKNLNAVCANYGRFIGVEKNAFLPYREWKVVLDEKIHDNEINVIAIGFGGILYPPTFYKNFMKQICDEQTIMKTCLRADDLWLKVMEMKTGTPLVISSYYANPPSIRKTATSALSVNNSETGNDEQWAALNERFGIANMFFCGNSISKD